MLEAYSADYLHSWNHMEGGGQGSYTSFYVALSLTLLSFIPALNPESSVTLAHSLSSVLWRWNSWRFNYVIYGLQSIISIIASHASHLPHSERYILFLSLSVLQVCDTKLSTSGFPLLSTRH